MRISFNGFEKFAQCHSFLTPNILVKIRLNLKALARSSEGLWWMNNSCYVILILCCIALWSSEYFDTIYRIAFSTWFLLMVRYIIGGATWPTMDTVKVSMVPWIQKAVPPKLLEISTWNFQGILFRLVSVLYLSFKTISLFAPCPQLFKILIFLIMKVNAKVKNNN